MMDDDQIREFQQKSDQKLAEAEKTREDTTRSREWWDESQQRTQDTLVEDTPMDDTQAEQERTRTMEKVVEAPQNYQLQPKGTKKRPSPKRWGQTPSPKKRQKTIFEYAGLGVQDWHQKQPTMEVEEPHHAVRGPDVEPTAGENRPTETTAQQTNPTLREEEDKKDEETDHWQGNTVNMDQ